MPRKCVFNQATWSLIESWINATLSGTEGLKGDPELEDEEDLGHVGASPSRGGGLT